MKNNCLVTKLKSVVDNDNLKVLGSIDILVNSGDYERIDNNFRIYLIPTVNCEVAIIGNGYFRSGESMDSASIGNNRSLTANVAAFLRFSQGDYKIRISKKYDAFKDNLLFPYSCATDISFFKYNPHLKDIKYTKKVDFDELASYLNKDVMEEIELMTVEKGSIYSLNTFTSFKSLRAYSPNITGDVEKFVSGQVNAGRTENLTGVNFGNCPGLKFNGSVINNTSTNSVTWTPTTGGTSVTMQGTTIVIDSIGNIIG